MESPMPVSVKKLLADLIELYGLWGEVLYLFKQKEVNQIYIIQIDELFKNRIIEPLEAAETSRENLISHFDQIKFEFQIFNIEFQQEILDATGTILDLFNKTFKNITRKEIYKSLLVNLYELGKAMDKFYKQILAYAGFFSESEKAIYKYSLDSIHTRLQEPIKKELPVFAVQVIKKFLPAAENIDDKTLLTYVNNRAVVVIVNRLLQFEPWKTITNPEAFQKILGNIDGPDDERYLKIFTSPVALHSLKALTFTKEQEERYILGNKELIVGLSWLLKSFQRTLQFKQVRILFNIIEGNRQFIDVLSISKKDIAIS